MAKEFAIIEQYFQRAHRRTDVIVGSGDDCALVQIPPKKLLAMTTDTLVSGVHFFPDVAAKDLGYKALAVNLSDLAAMGAEPAWVTLALTLPEANPTWLADFSEGFFSLLDEFNVALVGGDMTQGPLSITCGAYGFVPEGGGLKRTGAKPGDEIYVTGQLGDAGLGLQVLRQELPNLLPYAAALERLHRPFPRIREGLALSNIASSAIDISDGLLGDLGHILAQSGVGARVMVDQLPLSPLMQQSPPEEAYELALTAGDDYELCFTVPPNHQTRLQRLSATLNCPLTLIGVIESQPGLRLYQKDGTEYPLQKTPGYEHFGQ